jgi:hypothetical protein
VRFEYDDFECRSSLPELDAVANAKTLGSLDSSPVQERAIRRLEIAENNAFRGRIDARMLPRHGLGRIIRNHEIGAGSSADAKGVEHKLAIVEWTVGTLADAKANQHGPGSQRPDES